MATGASGVVVSSVRAYGTTPGSRAGGGGLEAGLRDAGGVQGSSLGAGGICERGGAPLASAARGRGGAAGAEGAAGAVDGAAGGAVLGANGGTDGLNCSCKSAAARASFTARRSSPSASALSAARRSHRRDSCASPRRQSA